MRTAGAANWTEAEEATIRTMWAAGAFCTDIAAALGNGKTRNAISGKARRLKLPYRRETNKDGRRVRAKGEPFRARRISVLTGLSALGVAVSDDRWANSPVWSALPGTKPVSLLDLATGMCKWPIGEKPTLFCGQPATDGVYCRHHYQLSIGAKPC